MAWSDPDFRSIVTVTSRPVEVDVGRVGRGRGPSADPDAVHRHVEVGGVEDRVGGADRGQHPAQLGSLPNTAALKRALRATLRPTVDGVVLAGGAADRDRDLVVGALGVGEQHAAITSARKIGLTTNEAPASMTRRAVSASVTVPAPSRNPSGSPGASSPINSTARGTVIVTSSARTPPSAIASTTARSFAASFSRMTATTPSASICAVTSQRLLMESLASRDVNGRSRLRRLVNGRNHFDAAPALRPVTGRPRAFVHRANEIFNHRPMRCHVAHDRRRRILRTLVRRSAGIEAALRRDKPDASCRSSATSASPSRMAVPFEPVTSTRRA